MTSLLSFFNPWDLYLGTISNRKDSVPDIQGIGRRERSFLWMCPEHRNSTNSTNLRLRTSDMCDMRCLEMSEAGLDSIFPNLSKSFQIFPNLSKSFQIFPNLSKSFQIFPNLSEFHQDSLPSSCAALIRLEPQARGMVCNNAVSKYSIYWCPLNAKLFREAKNNQVITCNNKASLKKDICTNRHWMALDGTGSFNQDNFRFMCRWAFSDGSCKPARLFCADWLAPSDNQVGFWNEECAKCRSSHEMSKKRREGYWRKLMKG